MAKIVTFGEIMLRLAPEGYLRFFQNDRLEATFGGAEANTAISLAQFGWDCAFVTRLPDHAIGQSAVNLLRSFGVDTSRIVRGGERVGIYFLEKGASQRPSVCIYDRAHSAIADATPSDFNWDAIFSDADWFHFTGITPALGEHLPQICLEACRAAKKRGIPVSFDPNYRAKLWSKEHAQKTVTALCPYIDLLISNVDQVRDMFDIEADAGLTEESAISQSVAQQLSTRFGISRIAFTSRISHSASDNDISGMLWEAGESAFSRTYSLRIVDRVGGGDAFAAGLIDALLRKKSLQDAIEFAVAASAIKHSIEGDINLASHTEVETLAGGDGSGRVQR